MEGSTEPSADAESSSDAAGVDDGTAPEQPDPSDGSESEPSRSDVGGETRHDFGRSVWLASHRSGAFRHSAAEIARLATDVMGTWNAGWGVSAGELRVGFPPPEREVDCVLLHFTNWQERGLVLIDSEISLSILVHLLGDPTLEIGESRTLSALEYSVIELIIEPLVELTTSQLLLGGGTRLVHMEGKDAAFSSATPDLTFLVLAVDTGSEQGNIEIGLPTVTLQTFAEFVDRRQAGARSRTEGRYSPQAMRALGAVGLDAIVRFDPFPVSALVVNQLKAGDVLRTGHPVHRPLTAVIGGKPLYRVEAGQRGDRLVAEVVDVIAHPTKGLLHP